MAKQEEAALAELKKIFPEIPPNVSKYFLCILFDIVMKMDPFGLS